MQPVRSADYPAHPSLAQVLAFPTEALVRETSPEGALAAWRDYLRFEGPLLLVSTPDRARKLLMQAFGVAAGEPVGVPANCRRFLSEAVKKSGGVPRFIELDLDLEFVQETPGLKDARLVWAQPVGGMAPPAPIPGTAMLVDHGLTLAARWTRQIPACPTWRHSGGCTWARVAAGR